LVRNHQKVHQPWNEIRNPKRTIQRAFSGEDLLSVSGHMLADLIALAEADIRGATPVSREITENKLAQLRRFGVLVREVIEARQREEGAREFEKMVRTIWNGHSVLRYFHAEGPQIGHLVKLGQDYVRAKLTAGEKVTEDRVREYLSGDR
jgi:hypothetical protein